MKISKYSYIVFAILIGCNGSNQTKEEEQLHESIETKEIVKENNTIKEKTEKESQIKKNSNDDWYWENTVASENNKLANWQGGEADIMMGYRLKPSDRKMRTLKVGTVDTQGTIEINLPSSVTTESQLNDISNLVFFDMQDASSLTYSKAETGYFSNSSLMVMHGDTIVGRLTIGNSIRVTYNLTNQSTLYSGDQGYILYWTFTKNDCALIGNEDWSGEVRRDGTNTLEVTTNVNYDLNFESGWNLVKTEVVGSYQLDHERGLDVSWFKSHRHTIIDELPNDAVYYFRKSPEF